MPGAAQQPVPDDFHYCEIGGGQTAPSPPNIATPNQSHPPYAEMREKRSYQYVIVKDKKSRSTSRGFELEAQEF